MNKSEIITRFTKIESQREYLVKLLEKPNIGTLRLDVNQAIEELDELIEEFAQTFPDEKISNY
jgi:hypothetical protein